MAKEYVRLAVHGERFYTRRGVDVCFADRTAWVWADDGPSQHASIVGLDHLLAHYDSYIDGPDAERLRPLLERLAAGADPAEIRRLAFADYRARHGADPEVLPSDT